MLKFEDHNLWWRQTGETSLCAFIYAEMRDQTGILLWETFSLVQRRTRKAFCSQVTSRGRVGPSQVKRQERKEHSRKRNSACNGPEVRECAAYLSS